MSSNSGTSLLRSMTFAIFSVVLATLSSLAMPQQANSQEPQTKIVRFRNHGFYTAKFNVRFSTSDDRRIRGIESKKLLSRQGGQFELPQDAVKVQIGAFADHGFGRFRYIAESERPVNFSKIYVTTGNLFKPKMEEREPKEN